MDFIGWYYLHQNGDLIFKRDLGDIVEELRQSPFVRHIWPMRPNVRELAWNILVEGLSLGADPFRVKILARDWYCDNEDAPKYAKLVGIKLSQDGNMWHAAPPWFLNLQESDSAFGETALEAMANLAKELKFPAGKTWPHTMKTWIETLVKQRKAAEFRLAMKGD